MKKQQIRKFILKILCFIIITIGFPAILTLAMNGKINSRVYSATESGKYVIINSGNISETMDVENFIPCAIMGQLSIDNDEELLKAFAVILRTYIHNALQDEDSISADSLNIPYFTYDQLESLWDTDFPDNYNRLMKVVSDTSLQVITCNDALISPYYHSVSAGKTRNGNELLDDNFSYLCSVSCPDDTTSADYFKAYYYSNQDFSEEVRSISDDISIDSDAPLSGIQIVSRDSAGYVLDMNIGGVIVAAMDFYSALNLNSPSFMIEEYNGGIRISTYGAGHGFGLSLNYAACLSSSGSSYIEILNYFYTNIKIS